MYHAVRQSSFQAEHVDAMLHGDAETARTNVRRVALTVGFTKQLRTINTSTGFDRKYICFLVYRILKLFYGEATVYLLACEYTKVRCNSVLKQLND